MEESKISNSLKTKTAAESIKNAEHNIIDILELNPQLHDKFINNSLEELERVTICQ